MEIVRVFSTPCYEKSQNKSINILKVSVLKTISQNFYGLTKFCYDNLNFKLQVLAEVTLRPQLTTEEIESARQAVAFELETLSMRPEQETILMDMIHGVSIDYLIFYTNE